jgi:hypothetical protein
VVEVYKGDIMLAVIKKTKVGNYHLSGHSNSFTNEMLGCAGKIIEVKPDPTFRNWYYGKLKLGKTNYVYGWHASWLFFPNRKNWDDVKG